MKDINIKEQLKKSVTRYSNLLQTEVILLNGDGTVFLPSGSGSSNSTFFPLPLDQCIDQPIQLKSKHDYSLAPYYYCLPVIVNESPRYFVAVSGFDAARISRECALVATGISEMLCQMEIMSSSYSPPVYRDPQAQLVESICQNYPPAQIITLLHTLKIEPIMLRAVICIEFSFNSPNYFERLGTMEYEILRDNTYHEILKYVREHAYFNRHDISAIANKDELVVIKSFPVSSNIPKAYRTIDTICNHLLEELSQFGIFQIHLAHGNLTADCSELHKSYSDAKLFLKIGKQQHPDIKYYNAGNLMLDLICNNIHPQISAKVIQPMLTALQNESGDIQNSLLQCAEAMVDSCMSYSSASHRLMLHRNTLHTRLERFCEITGLDPIHNFYDAVAVKLAAISLRHKESGRYIEEG
ncbi:MAG: PucR family transcriptional regulator [Candidatus Heteroscillospira sp.]|jgi:hypothetical protein